MSEGLTSVDQVRIRVGRVNGGCGGGGGIVPKEREVVVTRSHGRRSQRSPLGLGLGDVRGQTTSGTCRGCRR